VTSEQDEARRAVARSLIPPALLALFDKMDANAAASPAPPPPRCTRLTATGRACCARAIQLSVASPWIIDLQVCGQHLTAAERDRRGHDNALYETAQDQHADRPPACWSWPLPDVIEHDHPAQALETWQDGRCAACGQRGRYLVEDHDHETGMVRGLLDQACNGREGRWSSDGPHLFAYYRRRPATAVLGVAYRYVSVVTGPDMGTSAATRAPDDQSGPDNVLAAIGL
jgi:Recombination endonuclease VII